jgi:hypothetical protein
MHRATFGEHDCPPAHCGRRFQDARSSSNDGFASPEPLTFDDAVTQRLRVDSYLLYPRTAGFALVLTSAESALAGTHREALRYVLRLS